MTYSKTALREMRVDELRAHAMAAHGISPEGLTKDQLVEAVLEAQELGQEPPDAPEPEPFDDGTVIVMGTGPASRIAFWERHPLHPNGEVAIRGGQIGRVALTSSVARALGQGRLHRMEG